MVDVPRSNRPGPPSLPNGVRRNTPPHASLRVYSPQHAFDDAEQLLIRDPEHILDAEDSDVAGTLRSLARVLRPSNDPFPHATLELYRRIEHPTDHGLVPLFCPGQEPIRAGMSASLLEEDVPDEVLDQLIPPASAQAHSDRLQNHGMWLAGAPLFTRTATWMIPLGWYALFGTDDEQQLYEDDDAQPLSAVIRTPLALAVERAASAVPALSAIKGEVGMLAEVSELHDWLTQFHPESVVELDYGLLAARMWPDESVADVRDGLDALLDADASAASAAYFRLIRRWERAQAWACAN